LTFSTVANSMFQSSPFAFLDRWSLARAGSLRDRVRGAGRLNGAAAAKY
jgi:hypothetical protein